MNLFVRADSSPGVGAGHVMRCLALGQACVDRGGAVVFATRDADSPLLAGFDDEEGLEIVALSPGAVTGSAAEADEAVTAALERGADWVVLDGYRFDGDYQQRIGDRGLRLLVLDDFGHAARYVADAILNQNLHAEAAQYEPAREGRRLLLGPRYALLRREFAGWEEWKRQSPDRATRILVTLGGGEAGGALATVLESLAALDRPELHIRCLVGPLAREASPLRQLADGLGCSVSLESATREMPELMAWADVAVTGGGSTCWELAFMGLPALILAHNPHQELIARSVDSAGTALYAGRCASVIREEISSHLARLLDAPELRRRMSARGRELVDGRGARRVMQELEDRLAGEAA